MNTYDDIINLSRPVSKKHKPMSLYNRAAQFAPFAALTGYEDVIEETGRTTEETIDLDEYQMTDINNQLLYLIDNKDITAEYTYFLKDKYKKGGSYISTIGKIKKVVLDNNTIILDNKSNININDIVSIKF